MAEDPERWKSSGSRYLRKRIYGHQPAGVKAVGFKIFYGHAPQPPQGDCWCYLVADRDIRVILLRRTNLLRAKLSLDVARLSQRWGDAGSSDPLPYPRVSLPAGECEAHFGRLTRYHLRYARRFRHHALLRVSYEELVAQPELTMDRIQRFLGLEPRRLASRMKKQETRPLADAIANYSLLKERFRGSRWERFFDE
jgi:hypothetical protein